ncbi:MAG TPA: hypothetical protein VK718_02715 [Ferruginibacter sp.]|nr:hypothetical protein [Ferruginibacter sp.]
MVKFRRIFFIAAYILLILASKVTYAQVINNVQFGRNRVQYKTFKWKYYQTKNFNTYFNQNGQELAKFVAQVAEQELPDIESFTEYNLQRRINIVVYNKFSDLQQSNIGIGTDWQTTAGLAKLVNNKMIVYFNGDHDDLRKQIRQGIASTLTQNILFGDNIGEFVGNQALLDLPQWMTDGYSEFAAENWSPALDDELKGQILDGNYKNFNRFANEKPLLAGHAFWYYIQEKYKKENVTYLFYLARIYKNLNKACMQVCKKKFKYVVADFMVYENDKYENDNNRRKAVPKGDNIETFEIRKRRDYYRVNVNPNKKDNSYAYIEYNKGIVKLKLNQEDGDKITTLLKYGIRSYQNETDPGYPLMAWDPKGTRLTVIYTEKGRVKLFVYDLVTRLKYPQLDLTDDFDQVQDVKYLLDSKTLVLSAAKNGHSDIFTLNLATEKVTQVTDDVYDDLDATFISFPNKTGIIFSSNRPSATAKSGDTVLPSNNRYNIFLVTNFGGKPEFNQITQLSNLKYGNARYPTPYNENHFTFISDQNGIANRYAGFFTTKSEGLDTLVLIGDSLLRNPDSVHIASVLQLYKKNKPDTVAVEAMTSDSAITFSLSNYENSVLETRIAGDKNQVSELSRDGDEKQLYKLKIDEHALHDRNVKAPPTQYMKTIVMADNITTIDTAAIPSSVPAFVPPVDTTTKKPDDVFQNEFANQKTDTTRTDTTTTNKIFTVQEEPAKEGVLDKAKLFVYKPSKFSVDYGSAGFSNSPLFTDYQKYQGGQGPIELTPTLSALLSLGTIELMEDQSITGAISLGLSGAGSQELISYQNVKRRLDWGLTYYRNSLPSSDSSVPGLQGQVFNTKIITNIGQANIAYPFDNARRIGFTFGVRNDRTVYETDASDPYLHSLFINDVNQTYALTHLEYVYDNTLNPTQNIWEGTRYKFFIDANKDITKGKNSTGKFDFDWGFDIRYYHPIYRNFIWALRAAGNFSWGDEKTVYYLGGEDGQLMFLGGDPKFNSSNTPAPDQTYAFQSLAENLRGYIQNVANGNNALVINSEFRFPVLTTLLDRPINNAFLRNFQIIQFIDLGNAWNGSYGGLSRPQDVYGQPPVQVTIKTGGIGPFAGGYGFGARSSLLGYFLKFDVGWPMGTFFQSKPVYYYSLGLDF